MTTMGVSRSRQNRTPFRIAKPTRSVVDAMNLLNQKRGRDQFFESKASRCGRQLPTVPVIRALTREAYAKWILALGRELKPMTADYNDIARKIALICCTLIRS
jgi:hypothetical protein